MEKNVIEIKDYIEEFYWGVKKKIVILGYLKGGVDVVVVCFMFWDDLKDKVVGFVFI